MTRISTAHKLLTGAFAILCALALVGADLGASAQNTNSSTTDAAAATQTDPRAIEGTQEDLSGTYTGNLRTSGGHDMSAPSTLTITGTSFTIAATDGSMTHSGTITAVNSRGYIGATLRFGDVDDTTSNTRLTFSVRARKSGDRLTLTPAPGERNRMWFSQGGGGGSRRARRRAPAPPAADAAPTPEATPPPAN
jgi:hypothetical protein